MRLRRRIAELEARIDALEDDRRFNGEMPPAPTLDTPTIEPHTLWRERCTDYATVNMVDIDDDRARPTGQYL